MKITLTRNKTGMPVEIDTDTVQLITVMDDGCTRIVTEKDVFYVKESLDTIAMMRAGIKDPGEINRLKDEMTELQKKISGWTDQINAARAEYTKKDKELNALLEKAYGRYVTLDSVLNSMFM